MEDLKTASFIALVVFLSSLVLWAGTVRTAPLFRYSPITSDVVDIVNRPAREAEKLVAHLHRDIETMDGKLDAAVDSVVGAQTQAERDAAKARLDELRQQKYELEKRIAEAKAAALRTERLKGSKVSKECQHNPLLKGCI